MRTLLLFTLNGQMTNHFNSANGQSLSKELKELKVAAGGLLPGEGPITIVSREGPTDGEENSSKKKKKGKDRKIPERGFKTSSLQDAIEAWQYKFNDAQGENSKLEKKELKSLVAEGRMLNFKSLLSEVLGKSIDANDDADGADKFCDYGCYCVHLDFSKSEWIGKGKPVDEIDKLCLDLSNCYKCAKYDQGKHCDGQNNYDWYTKVNGKIKCGDTDHNDSCQSQVCDCDLQFANGLRMITDTYSRSFHKEGGFDRKTNCQPAHGGEKHPGQARPNAEPTECCGVGIQRSPFKPNKSECCADGRIESIGEC